MFGKKKINEKKVVHVYDQNLAFTNYKRQNMLSLKLRDYDLMTTTMSMIGLLIAMIQYEYEVDTEKIYTKKEEMYKYRTELPEHTRIHIMCRLVVFISSWFSVACMMRR